MSDRIAYAHTCGNVNLFLEQLDGHGMGGHWNRLWFFHLCKRLGLGIDIVTPVDLFTERNAEGIPKELDNDIVLKPTQFDFSKYRALVLRLATPNLQYQDRFLRIPSFIRVLDIIKSFSGPVIFIHGDPLLNFVFKPELIKGSLWEPYAKLFSSEDLFKNKQWYILHQAQNGERFALRRYFERPGVGGVSEDQIKRENFVFYPYNFEPAVLPRSGLFREVFLTKRGRTWDTIYVGRDKPVRVSLLKRYFNNPDAKTAIVGKWSKESLDALHTKPQYLGAVPPTDVVRVKAKSWFQLATGEAGAREFGWVYLQRHEGYASGSILLTHKDHYGAENIVVDPKLMFSTPEEFWMKGYASIRNWNTLAFQQAEQLFKTREIANTYGEKLIKRALKGHNMSGLDVTGLFPRPDLVIHH